MASVKPALTLFAVLAFAGAVASVHAEPASAESATAPACDGLSANDSDRAARKAEKSGEYERASECFVVAGNNLRAHRASMRAAGAAASAAKRSSVASLETAKSQARRIREAFR